MWSRNKPMRVDTPVEITEAQKVQANFGMNVQYSENLDNVIESALRGDWGYLPPRAGIDWCRLTDFVGYRHDCVRPCTTKLMDASMEADQKDFLSIYFDETTDEAANIQENVNLKDIEIEGRAFKDCYFCIVVIDKNQNKIYGATSNFTLGNGNNLVNIQGGVSSDAYWWEKGDYTMVPLISSIHRNTCLFKEGQSWSGGWFATLPTRPGILTVRQWDDIDFYCKAKWIYSGDGSRNAISFDLFQTNRTSQPVNIGVVTVKCGYYDRREENDPVKVYLWEYKVGNGEDIIIPANVEDADTRLGGSIEPDVINNEDYFVELLFSSTYVEDWAYDVED